MQPDKTLSRENGDHPAVIFPPPLAYALHVRVLRRAQPAARLPFAPRLSNTTFVSHRRASEPRLHSRASTYCTVHAPIICLTCFVQHPTLFHAHLWCTCQHFLPTATFSPTVTYELRQSFCSSELKAAILKTTKTLRTATLPRLLTEFRFSNTVLVVL